MAAESPRSAPRRTPAAKSGAGLLSPRFRSAAELAGWDEESILLAALVVEDTPVRESRRKRRPSGSSTAGGSAGSNTRKRRSRRQSADETPIPPVALVLDDDEKPNDHEVGTKEVKQAEEEKEKVSVVEGKEKSGSEAVASGELPCMDRLREELSCAVRICLDICYQPSTTPCGHSFCMQCLKHAASKCGKRCPKCRQLISNSRSCTINTVLWNTIQLLFPSEVEARKSSMASSSASKDDVKQSLPRSNNYTEVGIRNTSGSGSRSFITQDYTRIGNSTRSSLAAGSRRSMPGPGTMNTSSGSFDTQGRSTRSRDSGRGFVRASQLVATRSSARSGQSDDASLAYRLQQEEFMTAFDNEGGERQPQNTISTARANLRAMASRAERAVLLRARGWPL
ncbi:unnamed protein product [Triticum turgidum subsp. durum]|uniref:RING-type E3 ubiquitin transferase n=1 Tax=Triticum turgidum subsp. durum TaxID=4567 RepID=A0A9R0YUF0_TRITD|nr:unnamed protein product [Triticum turgidum subsp. durum]